MAQANAIKTLTQRWKNGLKINAQFQNNALTGYGVKQGVFEAPPSNVFECGDDAKTLKAHALQDGVETQMLFLRRGGE